MAVVSVEFQGQVTYRGEFGGGLDPSIVYGAPINGTYSFDPVGAVDVDPDPEEGEYSFSSAMTVQVGNVVIAAPNLSISVGNASSFEGQWYYASSFNFVSGGKFYSSMTLRLDTLRTDLFTEALPTHIEMSDLFRGLFYFSLGQSNVQGEITSVSFVPEPSTAAMVLLAAAGLANTRRRGRRGARH
jgi:hypothetical protein